MIYHIFNDEIVPAEQQKFIQQLFACKTFAGSDRLLGSSTGRGITWFLNTQDKLGLNAVLRHYYRGGLFSKVVKDRYLFNGIEQTRAFQEFELLKKMHALGLPVPRPIAIQIDKANVCYSADIMLEKIEHTQDLSKLLQKDTLRAEQYHQIGALIRRLHQHQIHHSDLNIHNILLDHGGKFWLIDFDKCGIEQGDSWKQHNLNRLRRSFHKEQNKLGIAFTHQDWAMLLAGYHA